MSTVTLDQIQRLVDQLTPEEQECLLEYLAPRIAQFKPTKQPSPWQQASTDAWQSFFRLGDALAASDNSDSPTLTQSVLTMRR